MFSVSTFEPRTLAWWHKQQNKIDMNPTYQRQGGLWSKRDKAFLIDSILNDYDIPKLYMADFTTAASKLNQKKLQYAIIDGKQRLEAVFEFLAGKIALNDDFVFQDNPKLSVGGMKYPALKEQYPDLADKVELCHLTIMRVITNDEPRINEMFVRLNRNKSLTGAEIRNAMVGAVPEIIRLMVSHAFFSDCVSFKKTRGEDKNTAAKILAFEIEDGPIDTKRDHLDEVVQKGGALSTSKLRSLASEAISHLDMMAGIFAARDPLLKSAGNVPVIYWFLKDVPKARRSRVRPFLIAFMSELRVHQKRVKAGYRARDTQLNAFQDAMRSTNDQWSYEKRIEILTDRFSDYIKSHKD